MTVAMQGRHLRQRRVWDPSAMLGARSLLRYVPASPPRSTSVAAAAAGLALADTAYRAVPGSTFPGGPLDELAHLLTTLLVLWALRPRAGKRFRIAALIASVAIDLDHVPDRLGYDWLTEGTPRPYTHSLLTIVVIGGAALASGRRRDVLLGAAFGIAAHFFRDLGEISGGISLLWPLSYHRFSMQHGIYVGAMTATTAVAFLRASRLRAPRNTQASPQAASRQRSRS